MKFLTKAIAVLSFAFAGFIMTPTAKAQSVLDPNDPVITYNPNSPPVTPPWGTIAKWVRTKRLTWNTDSWKCYILNTIPFRLKFPKTYNPTANDGKRYPMIVFFHGAGEKGEKYDNEFSMANGGVAFTGKVDDGTFDGFILIQQSPGTGWSSSYIDFVTTIVDYMVANNKLDPFRISANGLSAGAYACWDMVTRYPQYATGSLPMSGISLAQKDPANIAQMKFNPMWYFQGGVDNSPAPSTALEVKAVLDQVGTNFRYTLYPTLGHGTWTTAWNEPDFYPFVNRVYASNPWPLLGRTEFCPGENINVTIGVAPGFSAYEWRKDGVLISGATTNSIQVTTLGTYEARVRKGTLWSDWSRIPVQIKIKQPTVTPPITVSGLMSPVIPALDTTKVTLKVPSGYVDYVWQKVGSSATIGTDSTLNVSTPGDYIVKVTEQYGCSSNFSTPFTVVNANGPNKPSPAASLLASALSKTSIRLDWSENPAPQYNETNFEVYQATKPGGPYKLVGITGANIVTFTVNGLTPKVKYYYVIRAVNNTSASASSNEASATTDSDTQPPTAPGSLTVSGYSRTSVSLSWTASTDDVGVARYYVYVNGTKSFTTQNTQFTVNGLTPKQTYSFTVRAIDGSGNQSPASNQATAQPVTNGLSYKYYTYSGSWSALPNFDGLNPDDTGTMPNVALTPRTQNDNFAFMWEGYIVIPTTGTYNFATVSDAGSKIYLGSLNGTASPYSYTGTALVNNDGNHSSRSAISSNITLTAGVYPICITYFEVTGSESMTIAWKTPSSGGSYVVIPNSAFIESPVNNGSAPAKPTNLVLTPVSYKQINLNWTDASNNESGFEIYRSLDYASGFVAIATVPANTTSYSDTTLQPNTRYYYKLKAINQYGESQFHADAGVGYSYYEQTGLSVLPNFNSLTPVKTGRATNFALGMQNRADNFQLKFDGTINIPTTGTYTFYTNSDDGSKLYIDGFAETNKVVDNDGGHAAQERSGTKTLTAGTHSIYVTFMEITGGESLTVSWQGPGVTKQVIPSYVLGDIIPGANTLALPGTPPAPSNLLASATSTSANIVTWNDNANNETGYEVYRSNNNNSNYIKRATLPANSTSYNDSDLFSNSIYYYKVRAINVGGSSAYSNEDSAKTRNNIPVLTTIANQSMHQQSTMQIDLQATDVDASYITLSVTNLPAFATFQQTASGVGTITFNPSGTQGVFNNITVQATDESNASSSTSFNLTVNNNYKPVIAAISNYTVSESGSVSINLSATDQNVADVLTWSVSNLPNAYTLTPGANGAATLLLQPNFAAAGVYAVNVSVNDGNGGITTTQFNLTVTDKDPSTKIYSRVQYANVMGAPWNNMTGPTTNNLKDENNVTTSVGINFLQPWWLPYNAGPVTGNNSGVYPDAVMNDFWYFGYYGGPETASLAVTGLNPAKKYNLTFYGGSVFNGVPDNGTTNYTVGAKTVSLYVQNNTQNTVSINNITPAGDGTITVNMTKAAGTPIGYLNALVISDVYDDGTAPAAPKALTAQYVSGQGVNLSWQDVPYNETGFEIYRSSTLAGTYSSIGVADANAVSFLDNTVSGGAQYFYKVRAVNTYGNSAFTDVASITTQNRIPQIAPISDVIVKNNQSISVNVTATDDASDHITLTATGLPSFATFTDNGNGTGVVNIQPNVGSLGTYAGITITAKDNSDSARSTSFNIFVVDANVSSTYVNISYNDFVAPAPWNNLGIPFLPYAGTAATNLKDDGNVSTGVSVTLTTAWEGAATTGVRLRNGTELFPESVARTSIYFTDASTRQITVTGLNPAKKYNFVFFNSHSTSESALTNFNIGASTVSLEGAHNSNKTAQLNGIVPPANGTVVINVTKGAGAVYAMLSAMVIQSYTPGVVSVLNPTNLRVTDATTNSVSLQWEDRADNETGYEVWRANDGGSYSLIATLGANVTSYNNTSLPVNTTYNYIVRAKNGGVYSSYSNAVKGYTYASMVFINLNTANAAGAPWNNLNWPYGLGAVYYNFKDNTGIATNTGLEQPVKIDGTVASGLITGNNSGVYPDAVLAESLGMFPGAPTYLLLTGLNINKTYDITLLASLVGFPGDNTTAYTINGKTCLLNATNNKNGRLTMYGIKPDEDGRIRIDFVAYPGSAFALLASIVVNSYDQSLNQIPQPPSSAGRSAIVKEDTGVQPTEQQDVLVNKKQNTTILSDNKVVNGYPNPFNGYINLEIPSSGDENIQVVITDINGKQVYQKRFDKLVQGTNTVRIEPSKTIMPSGMYLVRVIYANGKEKTMKMIKQ